MNDMAETQKFGLEESLYPLSPFAANRGARLFVIKGYLVSMKRSSLADHV
jgi:hypothetical protein